MKQNKTIIIFAAIFTTILVFLPLRSLFAQSDLIVNFEVTPDSGLAPLNNVDISVQVSGTATGDITYKFDCTSNGSWEKIQTTSNTSYTAVNICDYPTPGNHIANIVVTRGGLVFDSQAAIVVQEGEDSLDATLVSIPTSGKAPLYDVDLRATASGTASGNIDYKFDCENDGNWDYVEYDVSYEIYTVYDVCDYEEAGSYTAKVMLHREGLTAIDTSTINVTEENRDLSVYLTANPDHGDEPLKDVDLTAVVSGTASGDIDYKFDCDNDGYFEYSYYDRAGKTLTARDACSYDRVGVHTARVQVWQDGLTATSTDSVRVNAVIHAMEFEVDKKVRNKTDGETTWRSSTNASPSDMLTYQITITAPNDSRLSNITIQDSMPDNIKWYGNEKINGKDLGHDMSKPLDLDDLNSGDSIEVTFDILLQEKAEFVYGATELVNRISVDGNNETENDSATIVVVKTAVAGATIVPTGALDNFWMSLGITVLSTYTILIIYFFYQKVLGSPSFRIEDGINNLKSTTKMRFYTADPFKTKSASEIRLQKKIEDIKKQER